MAKQKFYAYRLPNGKNGVVDSWASCEKLVSGKANARYRGFRTVAEAETWLRAGAAYEIKIRPELERGIYFDAGTGRGQGVEISVTDERGTDLLHRAMPKAKLNKHGKHKVPGEVTNNYGELLAMKYALALAQKLGVRHIFGDSKLVVEFWSQGAIKKKKLSAHTVRLAEEVRKSRRAFEHAGGMVGRVSGDHNPADLGFH